MPRALGPLEYVIVAFEGNAFTGEIVPALMDLIDKGLVRIIDLAVVSKDENGNVTTFDANELSADMAQALVKLDGEFTGLLSEEDLRMAAEGMKNNSTEVAMLFEHVWATRFSQAVREAHGTLVMNLRIPHDVVEAAQQSMIEAAKRE
jgi:hypothetical protein